jgi:lysophospholipase L1-like esterase
MTTDSSSLLALGDSYTIGESVDSALSWPVQLARALRSEGLSVGEPVIIARTGWTTDELAKGIGNAGLTGTYEFVSLLIGVNDQYRGRDFEEYRLGFRDLLLQAIAFTGGKPRSVLILSIPDWGVTPFAEGRDRSRIAREIDTFNRVSREESDAAGARYLDVTGISRGVPSDSSLLAEDGLHPSGVMYSRWVQAALPIAKEIVLEGQRGRAGGLYVDGS